METASHKMVNRSATPRPAPAAVPVRAAPAAPVQLQSAMRMSSPRDPAEREADATARKVMRMPAPEVAGASVSGEGGAQSPYVARFAGSIGLMRERAAAPTIARRAEGQPAVSASVAADIASSRGSGAPLPVGVRRFMEPRFGANFGDVRIHTGEKSAQLNRQVSAQAFTVGNQIFFGKDRFRPETHEGKELIAHELTHTIQQGAVQQGAVAQRSPDVTVNERSGEGGVQRLFGVSLPGVDTVLDCFASWANAIPGFRMLTLVLGVNPITMAAVDRSAANVLRAVVEFMPGGMLITKALDAYGVFDRAGAFIDQQLRSLGLNGTALKQALVSFLKTLSPASLLNPSGIWSDAQRIFTGPIERIKSFVKGLAGAVVDIVRSAILQPIAALASRTRAWDLLCAVLGQNPITGEPVPRNADTLIGGFMKLVGQEEIWENIKRANAVARAWSWFQGALSGLIGFVRQVPQLFLRALSELDIADLVLLPRAFARVAGVFGDFVGSFLSWAGNAIWSLLEIVFSVVAPGVMPYLRKAAGAFRTILRNPVGFVGNLVQAGIQGLRQFAARFLTHMRASLIGWLTGALSGAGIYIPQGFTLREIIKFVLSVLGLTWQNIRQKLVRAIGEPAVSALETGFDIVMTLVTQGPAAAWEKLQEGLTNLREMVMEQIMAFVQDRVVTAAITRLVSMLSPAGAFIQAVIAIYNTVMFFVERLRQIAQVAMSFIDSISAIASGSIAAAANRVEQTMGGLLTLVISFLARIAGLGRVSEAVTNVVDRVRQPIDRALDRVVDWIVAQAKRLGRFIAGAARGAAQTVTSWLGLRRPIRTVGGASHVIFFRSQGANAQLTIRSTEMSLEIFLAGLRTKYAGDKNKLAKVGAAETLVANIRRMTAPGNAPTAAAAFVDAAVQAEIDALAPILQEIGDGVSTDGATAAYRGLHWWVDSNQTDAQGAADPQYLANLTRQELGARQLSDAVRAVLARGLAANVDDAIRLVSEKMASVRDRSLYVEDGSEYFDRFHFLVGRYVTKLEAVRNRFAASARLLDLNVEIQSLRASLVELSRSSEQYHLVRKRLKAAEENRNRTARMVSQVYKDLAPQVTASPFIATSLNATKSAQYALGSLFTPSGKRRRTTGLVGRMLIFVASVVQLVQDGTYSIDTLAREEKKIKIRKGFSESELMFTASIPGEYLKATLEIQGGQSEDTVASSAMGRAAAEAARFGGLK